MIILDPNPQNLKSPIKTGPHFVLANCASCITIYTSKSGIQFSNHLFIESTSFGMVGAPFIAFRAFWPSFLLVSVATLTMNFIAAASRLGAQDVLSNAVRDFVVSLILFFILIPCYFLVYFTLYRSVRCVVSCVSVERLTPDLAVQREWHICYSTFLP